MKEQLESIKDRYLYLQDQLIDPTITQDVKQYSKISKEYKGLEKIVETYDQYVEMQSNIDLSNELLSDPEMKELAQEELESLLPQKEKIEEHLKQLLIPKDPDDQRDVLLEIRSGAGGDEAAIFAGDLYRMYTKYFEKQSWKSQTVNVTEGTQGGYSKLILEVNGTDVYGKLKFESGAHRVQRVPKTESQGRLHTSAATIVVMPKLELEDIDINKADLKVDTFRSSGAGGQHVNKTESGVRFTHLPTGIVAESTDGRSQIKNREIAIQRLYQKIKDAQIAAHNSEIKAARQSLVGSGDRSDKIRTYNYPQNRVTDHRLSGPNKNFSLQTVIEGDIDGIIEALTILENSEKMKSGEPTDA